jgi:hypothetical protein
LFNTVIGWAGALLMLGGCTFALTLGGKQERIGATAYLLCWFFTTLTRMTFDSTQVSSIIVLLLDTSLLVTFTALVWKAPNNWPVWAAACQLLVVTLQFLYAISFKPPLSAYITIVNVTALGIIISLIVGTFIAWQERAVIGSSRDDIGRYS